jgi:K+-sensing histidine kinase KdpD
MFLVKPQLQDMVQVTYKGEPYEVIFDIDAARLVIRNLLVNAYKYGDPDMGIKVNFCYSDEDVKITICNKLRGVLGCELHEIFNPYKRGKNAADKEGYGLGLYMSQMLMERMGGSLEASIEDNTICFNMAFVNE